ncbi:MAG: glutamate formimidoyltransferase [candidate division Zixibacteria bacterium]|nr:glutamate formimidoyltransferase [candidate division Zixibacteria bacterium]
MDKLVECIPNFSEGRRPEIIRTIAEAIASVESAVILDIHSDRDHNRSVITFVCDKQQAVAAAFQGYKVAQRHIDLNQHEGVHPRIGAIDVCPFVPLNKTTMSEAVELAEALGQRVADELHIPVYLYERAARTAERNNLANIRRGQFEELRDSVKYDTSKTPDFGQNALHPTAGATAIGARLPLIAFNVFLNTNDKSIGRKIADAVSGSRGGYRYVKALAFEIKSRSQIQVSMNLTDYRKTPIYRVFETIKSEASRYGVEVESSEIVGLAPSEALLDSGAFYLRLKQDVRDVLLEKRMNLVGLEGVTISAR